MTAAGKLEIGPAREKELGAVLELWAVARSPYSSTPDNPEVLARLVDWDAGAPRRGARTFEWIRRDQAVGYRS